MAANKELNKNNRNIIKLPYYNITFMIRNSK